MKLKHVVIAVCVICLITVSLAVWPRSKDHVLIVGDSVTFMSGGHIDDALDTRYDVRFVSIPYYRSIDLIEPVRQHSGPRDRVVVLVGYNDIRRGTDRGAGIERLMKTTANYKCRVFLTLPTGSLDLYKTTRWNRRLIALGAEQGTHISDEWKDVANKNSATLLEDGVHPTKDGQRALALAITNALDQFC